MTDQSWLRKQRLAVALRENLKRRKVQQRARASGSSLPVALEEVRVTVDGPAVPAPHAQGQVHDAETPPAPSSPDRP